MNHRLIYTILILVSPIILLAQKTNYNGVGRWRTHFPYKDVKQIQEAGEFIFVLPERGFFTFHQPSGEINVYSKVNGFADIDIAIMRYIEPLNKVVFVYTSGNIDILDLDPNKNTITNLPDITRKSLFGDKVFYDLQYYDGKAYLSSSFGLMVIDLVKLEISDSYSNMNLIPVYSAAIFKNYIYAGTPKGIMRALRDSNPADHNAWKIVKPGSESKLLRVFDGTLYAVNDSFYQSYDGNNTNTWKDVRGHTKRNVVSLEVCKNKLIETHWGGFLVSKAGVPGIDSTRENAMMFGIIDVHDQIWTGAPGLGLIVIKVNKTQGFIGINGPNSLTSHTIAGWRDEIWVTSGGEGFVFGPTYNGAGYYHFKDNRWENRPDTPPALSGMHDFTCIAINEGTGEVWMGSHGTGIARLQNGKFVERFDSNNSTLRKQIGVHTLVPGIALDSKGNLWASNYDTDNCVSVRFTNGKWQSFKLSTKYVGEMVIDDLDQKWMSTPRVSGQGLIVFKEAGGGKPQRDRILQKGKGSGDLPSNHVNALIIDKDNEIWIGTDEGLAVFFNPARAFDIEEDAQRIIVDQNGVVGYLLGSESINDMCIDGANRKWVATNNGAFLVEKDGTSVLRHFTVDNSPLPSNVIKSVGVNGVTGEVFFGTENGIISYGGDATEAGDQHTGVKIYPNPVKENYEGDITISGLPDYATVKITDVSGRLIYETLSNGGIATWNGRMFNGNKPQTGIYLIFSSNKEDKNSEVNKMLIVH